MEKTQSWKILENGVIVCEVCNAEWMYDGKDEVFFNCGGMVVKYYKGNKTEIKKFNDQRIEKKKEWRNNMSEDVKDYIKQIKDKQNDIYGLKVDIIGKTEKIEQLESQIESLRKELREIIGITIE